MPFLMSFALEPEIVTIAWIDKASVQFPLTIYATKGLIQRTQGFLQDGPTGTGRPRAAAHSRVPATLDCARAQVNGCQRIRRRIP